MSTNVFEGASAIVSGGAGGLGAATVRRLHAEGLAVVIADLAEDQGRALADELGDRAAFARTDVTDEDSVNAALDAAAALGTVRYAVIAHGGFGVTERIVGRDGSPADYRGFTRTIDLYLNGTFNLLRLASARIAKSDPLPTGERGAVVMTASIAGYEGQIGQASYTAAKAGRHRAHSGVGPRSELGRYPGQHRRAGHHAHTDHGIRWPGTDLKADLGGPVPEATG